MGLKLDVNNMKMTTNYMFFVHAARSCCSSLEPVPGYCGQMVKDKHVEIKS